MKNGLGGEGSKTKCHVERFGGCQGLTPPPPQTVQRDISQIDPDQSHTRISNKNQTFTKIGPTQESALHKNQICTRNRVAKSKKTGRHRGTTGAARDWSSVRPGDTHRYQNRIRAPLNHVHRFGGGGSHFFHLPARVDNWNGAQLASTASPNWRANVLATSLQRCH